MEQTVIIDGKETAKEIKSELKREVKQLKKTGVTPGLSVILVGDNPASQVYVSYKEKACKKVGINSEIINLPADISQEDLLAEVERLNQADDVDGILVQLPLPKQIDEAEVIAAIKPSKDVDGFHPINVGQMVINGQGLIPCTPKGIMELLAKYEFELEGKDAVVVGRSNIVGKPIAHLLLAQNATVTICHSRTKDLAAKVRAADIVIAAVGRAKFITAEMVKEGAIVIDVGINRQEDGLVGDVDFAAVKDKAGAITPVPGGVGPMTIASLLANTLAACRQRRG